MSYEVDDRRFKPGAETPATLSSSIEHSDVRTRNKISKLAKLRQRRKGGGVTRYAVVAVCCLLVTAVCVWGLRHGPSADGTARPPARRTLPGRKGRFMGTGMDVASTDGPAPALRDSIMSDQGLNANARGSIQASGFVEKAIKLESKAPASPEVVSKGQAPGIVDQHVIPDEKINALAFVDHNTTLHPELPSPAGFYSLHAPDIDGNDISFDRFVGKVVLVVNVASACGYTEQNYRGMQLLYEKYGPHGLEILAFPSNQFGGQEPGTNAHIKHFVTSRYNVTFPLMGKIDVNGEHTSPVFQYLKRELPADQGGGGGVANGNDLIWNFNKYLLDKHGRPVAFYYQAFDQFRLETDVYTYLAGA